MKPEETYQRFIINYPVIINDLCYNFSCIYLAKSILNAYKILISEYYHINCLINYIIPYDFNQKFNLYDLELEIKKWKKRQNLFGIYNIPSFTDSRCKNYKEF